MMRKRHFLTVLIPAAVFAAFSIGVVSGADGVPRMTKEELKGLLGSPDLVILDVRLGGENAPEKIAGAVVEDPGKVDAWAGGYPKGKRIVLYCS